LNFGNYRPFKIAGTITFGHNYHKNYENNPQLHSRAVLTILLNGWTMRAFYSPDLIYSGFRVIYLPLIEEFWKIDKKLHYISVRYNNRKEISHDSDLNEMKHVINRKFYASRRIREHIFYSLVRHRADPQKITKIKIFHVNQNFTK
jgi:hypothetical protein